MKTIVKKSTSTDTPPTPPPIPTAPLLQEVDQRCFCCKNCNSSSSSSSLKGPCLGFPHGFEQRNIETDSGTPLSSPFTTEADPSIVRKVRCVIL